MGASNRAVLTFPKDEGPSVLNPPTAADPSRQEALVHASRVCTTLASALGGKEGPPIDPPGKLPQGASQYKHGVPSRKRMRCGPPVAVQSNQRNSCDPSFGGIEIPDALLEDMISSLEQTFGSEAIKEFMSSGDVFANVDMAKLLGGHERKEMRGADHHGLNGTGMDGTDTSRLQSALEYQGEDQGGIVDGPCWVQL